MTVAKVRFSSVPKVKVVEHYDYLRYDTDRFKRLMYPERFAHIYTFIHKVKYTLRFVKRQTLISGC